MYFMLYTNFMHSEPFFEKIDEVCFKKGSCWADMEQSDFPDSYWFRTHYTNFHQNPFICGVKT
jgi:hypothetical protein